MNKSLVNHYLSDDPNFFAGFKKDVEVVSCFVEHHQKILVLRRSQKEDQSFVWGIPGGKIEHAEATPNIAMARELWEETGLFIDPAELIKKFKKYVRIPGWDYVLHVFQLKLTDKPDIHLSEEHVEAAWIPIQDFATLNLLKGQAEVFSILYPDSIISLSK